MTWTKDDMHQQSEKTVVITGTDKGIGFETALAFAEKGAKVILAVSELFKGRAVQEKILSILPNANIDLMHLDLDDLANVHGFVREYKNKYRTLSILILNENIMSPQLRTTKNGFESQFGINYLGHFALTGLLLDLLKTTPHSRVIALGTKTSKKTKLSFGHFKGSNNYKSETFYTQSKLANMLFAKHLDNKLKENKIQCISICCQLPNTKDKSNLIQKRFSKTRENKDDQNISTLPILYAATEQSLKGGEYIGLSKNKVDKPTELNMFEKLYDENVAHNLWQISERLCGVSYRF